MFVFMLNSLNPSETWENVLKMTPDGSLDHGKLVATGNFNDGRCDQINPASPISVERQK